jgi:hypothetical protein
MAKYFVARENRRPRVKDLSDMDHSSTKHKLTLDNGGRSDWFAHNMIFKSVRSINLQHILHINFLLGSRYSWLHQRLLQRFKDYYKKDKVARAHAGFLINDVEYSKEKGKEIGRNIHPCHLMKFLGYQDIMDAVGCSRRTAAEYRTVLAEIHGYYEPELN